MQVGHNERQVETPFFKNFLVNLFGVFIIVLVILLSSLKTVAKNFAKLYYPPFTKSIICVKI